jgi:hypothetical protein
MLEYTKEIRGNPWHRKKSFTAPRDRRTSPVSQKVSNPTKQKVFAEHRWSITHLVPWHGPAALGNELGGLLVDARLGSGNLVDGELVEGTGLLDVAQGLLKILELEINLLLGGLGVLNGLDLEGLDGLELAVQVVGGGLEGVETLLDLVNDGSVLEDRAVVGKVDGGRLLLQQLQLAAHVVVALFEGLQAGHRLAAQAERRRDLGPVDLESCASLLNFAEGAEGADKKLAQVFLRLAQLLGGPVTRPKPQCTQTPFPSQKIVQFPRGNLLRPFCRWL